MLASRNGYHDIIRTLLEAKADVNPKDNVRNQLMMMMIMMMMMVVVVINDEDIDICRF